MELLTISGTLILSTPYQTAICCGLVRFGVASRRGLGCDKKGLYDT